MDEEEERQQDETIADNERFVRWQQVAIAQLGYTLNLILTFTIAALGYAFSLLKDDNFRPAASARCALIISLVSLGIAAITGLACILNRLRDFQGTARRVRRRPDAPSSGELRVMGRTTLGLFKAHLFAFALGILALAITIVLTYGHKLT
jgi:hypothetical protein